jgi:mannosyltransferase OCH1-like enzyme
MSIQFRNNKERNDQLQQQKQKQIEEINNKIKEEKEKRLKLQQFKLLNKLFILKDTYYSIIPLHLYTCWHTKDLPENMRKNVEYVKASNPKFTHHLFDENDCREFIQSHFTPDVLKTYDSLIPDSYKSDLWRYCVLYINGGIYYDIKFKNINNFKFIVLTEKETFVRDLDSSGGGTLTGLIAVKPKNIIMFKCIEQIIENVKNNYYGESPLHPTGPMLLDSFFSVEEKTNMDYYFSELKVEDLVEKLCVYYKDYIILDFYPDYRKDKQNKHYSQYWKERNIYKPIEYCW